MIEAKPLFWPADITTRTYGKRTTCFIRDWRVIVLGWRPYYVPDNARPAHILEYETREATQRSCDELKRRSA